MSASVTTGFIPTGKPHPAMKWSVLAVLFVMVCLGVPRNVAAGQPTVGPPSGSQSGGVFIGPYTFSTYIYCDNGPSFNGTYTNALEGTHTFTFMASSDGSLLVRIDGGGAQLITSCGNTTPVSTVANYTVTYSSSGPPPPTPTPTPAPTPTPVISGGGGTSSSSGSSGGSSGGGAPNTGSSANAPHQSVSTPGAAPPAHAAVTTGSVATPTPTQVTPSIDKPAVAKHTDVIVGPSSQQYHWPWLWTITWMLVLTLGVGSWFAWRSVRLRGWLENATLGWRLKLEPHWFRWRLAWHRLARPHGRELAKQRGLSAHHHTGRLLAHHHTSYPALVFLLMVSTVVLGAYSLSSQADSTLSLTVLGPPPTTAATIDQPADGQTIQTATTTVHGTCPAGLLVEVYRNGSFVGSDACDGAGFYSVIITLLDGRNDLVARDLDGLSQYGPDSSVVTVQADIPLPPPPAPTPTPTPTPTPAPAPSSSPAASASPTASPSVSPRPSASPTVSPTPSATPQPEPALLLTTSQHTLTGIQAGSEISWPIDIAGGTAPYHLDWDWGDGTQGGQDTSDRQITLNHAYKQSGSYRLTVYARDATGQVSALSLAAVVNGPAAAPFNAGTNSVQGSLLLAWPLLGFSGILVFSFWLGEHHKLTLFRFGRPT